MLTSLKKEQEILSPGGEREESFEERRKGRQYERCHPFLFSSPKLSLYLLLWDVEGGWLVGGRFGSRVSLILGS